jgi:hypothetical protein
MKLEKFYGADKVLQRGMYDIRRASFPEFSPEEQMVYWQFDPLCTHLMVFDEGKAIGSISIGEYYTYLDVHEIFGVDKLIQDYSSNLRIKGVHRLATIPEVRNNIGVLKMLMDATKEEASKDSDFVFGYVAPSLNNPSDKSRYDLSRLYCRISGAKEIGENKSQGVTRKFFGRWTNSF